MALSQRAHALLLNYVWPGNVRELEHAIHRAIILARAERTGDNVVLEAHHIAQQNAPERPVQESQNVTPAPNLRHATEDFQRTVINQALTQNGHNRAASARALDIDVANLHRLAKRLGIKP